jgi:predicted nucleotidyltransferase
MAEVISTVAFEEIQWVVQWIVERFCPVKVILFVSYAYGKPHEGSDVDVLVVMHHPPFRRESWRLAFELKQQMSLQLVFMTPQEFEETKEVVGGLAYPAHHWGRVLYAADP